MKVELKLTKQVINDITNEANEELAYEMRTWLEEKSESPEKFYIKLAETIEAKPNKGIVGSGLCEYILSERGLVSEFIDSL